MQSQELDCAGAVLHWSGVGRLGGVAVVDRGNRDTMLQASVHQNRADHVLIAGHKSSAMDEDHERCRLGGVGFPEIEDIALVGTIGYVREVGWARGLRLRKGGE